MKLIKEAGMLDEFNNAMEVYDSKRYMTILESVIGSFIQFRLIEPNTDNKAILEDIFKKIKKLAGCVIMSTNRVFDFSFYIRVVSFMSTRVQTQIFVF